MKWPIGTRESQKQHAFNHVKSARYLVDLCQLHRVAIQAGGNVGLWPLEFSKHFGHVHTFEPDEISFNCLSKNLSDRDNVTMYKYALGAIEGRCSIEHRSLGSHRIIPGKNVQMITIDSLELNDIDLIQFDLEGYELLALQGAEITIRNFRPIIQVEMRNFTEEYGGNDNDVTAYLARLGYKKYADRPGNDVIFWHVNY